MSDIVEVTLAGEKVRRQSDLAVERLVNENRTKFQTELQSIHESDLDPQVYEGGLKVWECCFDLADHLSQFDLAGKSVLELGCGAALPSIVALKKGAAKVVCQDYNRSVIELVTKPNLRLNVEDESRYRAVAMSWDDFTKNSDQKFDFILTSETIYESSSYPSLYDALVASLKPDGIILLAAKMVYFGKTGDYFRFLDYIEARPELQVLSTTRIEASVVRIIAKIQRKHA